MIRALTIAVLALGLCACETDDLANVTPMSGAVYDPQRSPPPTLTAARGGSVCETTLRYDIYNEPLLPTPVERCIPRFPPRAMSAELTATCMTVFTLASDGGVALRDTTCEVGGLRDGPLKADWAAYGNRAFRDAAHTAIGRYRFDSAQTAGQQDKLYAIRTIFTFEDLAPPLPPALPANVVEILTPQPRS